MRYFGLLLTSINIVMSLVLFPARSLITFATNWNMLLTFISVLLCSLFVKDSRVNEKRQRLVTLHIIMEFAMILNLITFIIYWGVIHSVSISRFSGWAYIHMYTVHTFPTLAYFLNFRCTDFQLVAGHWKMFLPLSVVYSTINYFETKSRGSPLYWFLTWEDHNTVLILVALQVIFSLLWVALARLTRRDASAEQVSENKRKN